MQLKYCCFKLLSSFPHRTIRNFSSTVMAQVKVGDKLPAGELYEDSPANKININDVCNNKKIVIFGVPGAFTPGCSKTHLPGYVNNSDKIKSENGVDEIICVSVNDPFVMSAWAKEHNAAGKVRLLADPAASFVKALDLTVNLPPLGGLRSKRFSMIVKNNEIVELNVEPDGTGLSCSLAEKLGGK
ncbi:peroxiredoxin-5, mitochondrial [Condylostylus longicornis]|uniref:peroxiredoxin-5, mitochondrial n=1 Tax=Condylostylus longicornis TaxID=2530218 RepID=UPI00244E2361|nr:peroxiredoxin-5, mitochondrial [Condylostylus longicornis]